MPCINGSDIYKNRDIFPNLLGLIVLLNFI